MKWWDVCELDNQAVQKFCSLLEHFCHYSHSSSHPMHAFRWFFLSLSLHVHVWVHVGATTIINHQPCDFELKGKEKNRNYRFEIWNFLINELTTNIWSKKIVTTRSHTYLCGVHTCCLCVVFTRVVSNMCWGGSTVSFFFPCRWLCFCSSISCCFYSKQSKIAHVCFKINYDCYS